MDLFEAVLVAVMPAVGFLFGLVMGRRSRTRPYYKANKSKTHRKV